MKHKHMNPIRLECPAERYISAGYYVVRQNGDRIQVWRHARDGAASKKATLDFPVSQAALAVELANLLAGARHA